MNYYFDESGNWQEIQSEKRKLVIAGLFLKEKSIELELAQEIKIFQSRNRLQTIHATEMTPLLKEQLYQIIHKYVQDERVQVLIYYFNPKMLLSQTQKEPDEIYIEIASKLISDIAFGDDAINIEYDMKFHYAYPKNVLNNINVKNIRKEYLDMQKSFILAEEEYENNKTRIKKNISNSLNKIKDYKLSDSLKLLNDTKNREQENLISKYLWTEFRLKIEKTALLQEKFKDKIEDNMKQLYQEYNIPYENIRPKIKYTHKQYQSAGVQIIDVLSNLIYHNGNQAPQNASSAIFGIYNNIVIKDITDEI